MLWQNELQFTELLDIDHVAEAVILLKHNISHGTSDILCCTVNWLDLEVSSAASVIEDSEYDKLLN